MLGGSSLFVDALKAAEELRRNSPAEFRCLAETLVPFHYINNGHHLHYEHPTIELSSNPSLGSANDLSLDSQTPITHVNYSPPFMAPLFADTPPRFYDAFSEFSSLLARPENTYRYTLKEGDAVIFDNRRVLHARTAFNELEGTEEHVGETSRWLKGCYLEAEALLDRSRILRRKLETARS